MALQPTRFLLPVTAAVLLTGVLSPPSSAVPPKDREIEQMVRRVDAGNISRTIAKLASFGTRHTLSSQDDPARGVGAARDWIYDEFSRIAATSGGRMTVEKRAFTQPVSPRIPQPTVITNVVATLRGTQAESAGRTYVVSGHYDSRCTDVMDATCDAPGADDDASGVAVAIEAARVMAAHPFDATVVFMAVAGEEQGLYGSAHYAALAKQNNVDVQGMFTNDIVGSAEGRTAAIRAPSGCSPKAYPPPRPRPRPPCARRSAARATGCRGSSAASSPRRRGPTCLPSRPGRTTAVTGTCAAATRSRSCSRGSPRCDSPRSTRTTRTSTRTSGSRTACSSVIWRGSWSSTTWPGWRR
ncbi:M20/M25/M40 family metallo-hydrolase [Nonomuraea sp. NPDC050556]|uniref:M20/M25/M40 family metallo-hydrolase n=1 Tax=Nonomuraea sp. NPDC050556 TaxID=3364369 RepID=UPI0037AF3C46